MALYIELVLPNNPTELRQHQERLRYELSKWCYQHGLDYGNIRTHKRDNHQRIELPSTKAYELFCISWRPAEADLQQYRLVRN